MSVIGWIFLGLIAGAIAESILQPSLHRRWTVALVLGVVGALVGGFSAMTLFNTTPDTVFSIESWLLAVSGAIAILLLYGRLTRAAD